MAESEEVVVPPLGESVAEGTIASWLVKPGEAVAADQALVEIETDKAAVEVSADRAGVVAELLVEEGADVAPGTVIARIEVGADGAAPQAPPRAQT